MNRCLRCDLDASPREACSARRPPTLNAAASVTVEDEPAGCRPIGQPSLPETFSAILLIRLDSVSTNLEPGLRHPAVEVAGSPPTPQRQHLMTTTKPRGQIAFAPLYRRPTYESRLPPNTIDDGPGSSRMLVRLALR